jgi:hypothetical protein
VAGLTLGGGLGYLTRRFGWTVDNLLEAEVVGADGRVRVAGPDRHPDLFWALRGGGGNFGVVTRLSLRLHPVGPDVYGGLIAWPFERAAEVLAAYRELTAAAPRELAVWQLLLPAPPAPFVPAEWHGRRLCGMAVCYSGDLDDTERVLAPIRALGEPLVDLLGRRPYTEVQSYLDDTEPSGRHYYWKTEFLAGLDDGLLAGLRELFAACPIPEADLGLLHLDGALNERAGDDGAVGNRDARYVVGVKGMWSPGEPAADRFREWVRDAGAGCGRSRPGPPTSTSRPPTRATGGSGRPTGPTTSAWSRSSGATTRATCSGATATSGPEPPAQPRSRDGSAWTGSPSTRVARTRASAMGPAASSNGSRSRTARSASLPGVTEPVSASRRRA